MEITEIVRERDSARDALFAAEAAFKEVDKRLTDLLDAIIKPLVAKWTVKYSPDDEVFANDASTAKPKTAREAIDAYASGTRFTSKELVAQFPGASKNGIYVAIHHLTVKKDIKRVGRGEYVKK